MSSDDEVMAMLAVPLTSISPIMLRLAVHVGSESGGAWKLRSQIHA